AGDNRPAPAKAEIDVLAQRSRPDGGGGAHSEASFGSGSFDGVRAGMERQFHLIQWKRAAEKIALPFRTAGSAHAAELVRRLDALGRGRHAQGARQSGNGVDKGGAIRSGFNLADEGPVDLDRVERIVPQIAQRRVAGP